MEPTRCRTTIVRGLSIAALVAATFSGGLMAIVTVRDVLEAATPPTMVLFDHGLTGLRPEQIPAGWTNEQCGACHKEEYQQWSQSRHAAAGTNANFKSQFLNPVGGRQQWCLNCHTPINPGAESFAVQEPVGIDEAFAVHPPWLVNGVDCLACHVRDGKVLVTRASREAEAAHPIQVAPELNTAEFCGGCHQFGMKHEDFPDLLDHRLQQASFEEFLEFRASGGTETRCHQCHMPEGNHLMPGGYSVEMVQSAVDLNLSAQWDDELSMALVEVDLATGHVGHRVPGGEHLFRALTLQMYVESEEGESIRLSQPRPLADRLPRGTVVTQLPQIETIEHGFGPLEEVNPTPDTRLRPGETRRLRYLIPIARPVESPIRVRAEMLYHLLDDEDARSHGFTPDEVKWVVLSQSTSIELGDANCESLQDGPQR